MTYNRTLLISSITLPIDQARQILIDMGFEIPRTISNKTQISEAIMNAGNMTDDQIRQFIELAKKAQ